MLEVLGCAITSFILVQVLLRIISWIYSDSDQIYRSNLDRLIDEIDEKSFFELGKCLLIRLVTKIKKLSLRTMIPLILVGSFFLNVIVYLTTVAIVTSTHFLEFSSGIHAVLQSILVANIADFLIMNILIGLLGTIFDCLSLGLTLWLIYRASITTTARSLLTHLGVDLVVAAFAVAWAYVILSLMLQSYYDQIKPLVEEYAGLWAFRYLQPSAESTLMVNPDLWYVVIGLGLSTTIPTVIYILALAPILSFRLIPRRIQSFISLILFRMTTDNRPVLEQLSRWAKGISLIIGATVGLLVA